MLRPLLISNPLYSVFLGRFVSRSTFCNQFCTSCRPHIQCPLNYIYNFMSLYFFDIAVEVPTSNYSSSLSSFPLTFSSPSLYPLPLPSLSPSLLLKELASAVCLKQATHAHTYTGCCGPPSALITGSVCVFAPDVCVRVCFWPRYSREDM